MTLVAEWTDPITGEREIIGVAKLVRSHFENEAELAVSVSDVLQRHGIGLALAKELVEFARHEKLERITACVLLDNRGMRTVLEKVGFTFPSNSNDGVLEAELKLLGFVELKRILPGAAYPNSDQDQKLALLTELVAASPAIACLQYSQRDCKVRPTTTQAESPR